MNCFEIKNVNYTVKEQHILKNINIEIPDGSFTVVSGPSGSGKSTLLKVIGSLISPTSGDIIYHEKNQTSYSPQEYRHEIRGLDFDEGRAQQLLDTVGLSGFIDKGINDISGGEKQRVALIRNVIFMPKVLLLDEITSALDTESKQEVWKFINKLYSEEKLTIISVTHQVDEIENATHKIIIENGSVVNYES